MTIFNTKWKNKMENYELTDIGRTLAFDDIPLHGYLAKTYTFDKLIEETKKRGFACDLKILKVILIDLLWLPIFSIIKVEMKELFICRCH